MQTWSDIKYNLKKKASALKADITQTGGGPPIAKKFTDFEQRILQVLGKSFYEGVGSLEVGVGVTVPKFYLVFL